MCPLRTQVVPESVRTSAYAFDKCIAGAIGAFGAQICGLLAERLFGYHTKARAGHDCEPQSAHSAHESAAQWAENLNNARALENGLMWMTIVTLAMKFCVYGVRCAYPCTSAASLRTHEAAHGCLSCLALACLCLYCQTAAPASGQASTLCWSSTQDALAVRTGSSTRACQGRHVVC
jgi:hypothetical protein